jgi:transposase InsO family protein
VRQIRLLRLTRRELETWPWRNCEPTTQSKESGWKPSAFDARASSRPYRRAGVRNRQWQHCHGADARPLPYIPTWAGFLYLAVVLDTFSRRIVGWAMATHLRTELVLQALNLALWQRRPAAVIHHSDQGSQGRFKRSSQHKVLAHRKILV